MRSLYSHANLFICDRNTILASAALLVASALSVGAQTAADLVQLDQQLNAAYQQTLSSLPPARQSKLRAAERCWIAFADANEASLRVTARQRNYPASLVQQMRGDELSGRQTDLLRVARPPGLPDAVTVKAAEDELTAVYKQSLPALSPADQALLRGAQRAWIAWRDADAALDPRFSGTAATPLLTLPLTRRRIQQLRDFYLGNLAISGRPPGGAAPLPLSRPPLPVEPAGRAEIDPNTPDPFERVR